VRYNQPMAKKAIIFHGTDGNPNDYWYKWLAEQLTSRGYEVAIPHYPDINQTAPDVFVPKVLQAHTFDNETVLIGHSAGSPLILSLLERIDTTIAQAVLVAGFIEPTGKFGCPILQSSYNWARIKQHAQDFFFVNSDNDPWGCDDKQGRKLFDHLGGTLIIRHDGHFGSESHNQPYATFPLLDRLIP